MFGSMEIKDAFYVVEWAVVPTVVIPFAVVSVACSAIATFIAGLFGLELKWEGPKRLLEVLLKPRVLLSALVLNVFVIAGVYAYRWLDHYPSFLWTLKWKNQRLAKLAQPTAEIYEDAEGRANHVPLRDPAQPFQSGVELSGLTQVWRTQLPQGVFGSPVLSGGSVFVGADDGIVYELSQETGSILRRFYVGTEITPSPLIFKNRLFVGEGIHPTHHARVYSFDLKSGSFLGAFQTKGHTEGGIIGATVEGVDVLYVMAGKDGIYALDPDTMTQRWHGQGLGHIDSEVRVFERMIYFATGIEKGSEERTHRAYALDALTGDLVWQAELPASGWMPPVLTETDVCFGVGEIYTKSDYGSLSCYDKRSGTARVSVNLDAPVMGVPLLYGNMIVTSDLMGQTCAIQWPQGWRKWCHQTYHKTFASAVFDGTRYFVYPSAKDGLHVIDGETGLKVYSWKPGEDEGAWGKSNNRAVLNAQGWFTADMSGQVRRLKPLYQRQVSSSL